MKNKNIFPKCKQLSKIVTVEQFLAMNNDTCIMDAARQTLNKNLTNKYFKNEWEKHTEARCKTQDKTRLTDGTNDGQILAPTSRRQTIQRKQ